MPSQLKGFFGKMTNYQQIILDALKKVTWEPGYENDIHEVALCHRLAVYLENSGDFSSYLIDCEYNRDNKDIKGKAENDNFRVDIVIHARGHNKNNLIMIEAKKEGVSKDEKKCIKCKLKKRGKSRKYKHAFLVVFPKKCVHEKSVIEIDYNIDYS